MRVDTGRSETAEPGSQARQRVIDTARRRFLAHGFRNVTMDDLATELGMSKKTFYALFKSKVELVEKVMLTKIGGFEAEVEEITSDRRKSFPEALGALLECVQRHTSEIQPAFVRDIRRDAPEVFAMIETRRAAIIERCFTRLFNKGKKAGMIRGDIPVRLMIEILLAATHGIMNPRRMEELKLTPRAGYAAILNVVLSGAMTEKGRECL